MIFLFLILSFLLTACQPQEEIPTKFEGIKMMMHYKILIGSSLSTKNKHAVQNVINQTFEEVDNYYNHWNPNSELSRLNQLQAHEKFYLSKKLEKLLLETDKMVALTQGRFDPSILPLANLWKVKLVNESIPAQEEVEAISQYVGWKKIHLSNGVVVKEFDSTALDLGGIAKGYCIDLLIERLQMMGFDDLFVEWGGEIRSIGNHPDKRPWHVFISRLGDPDPNHAIAHIDLKNQALATSGDYLQYWEIKDPDNSGRWIAYFHIVDTKTLSPCKMTKERPSSITITAPTCTVADAIATSAMLFESKNEAVEWLESLKKELPNLDYWIVSRSE